MLDEGHLAQRLQRAPQVVWPGLIEPLDKRVGSTVEPLRRGCKLRQFACGLDLFVTSCCFDAQVAGTPMADEEEAGGEQPAVLLSPIAQPLANEKLAKKVLKVVKKGESHVVLAGTRAR